MKVGDVVGSYRVVAELGRGTAGAVYAAEQTQSGRKAALKVASPALCGNQGVVSRYFSEARAAATIGHPGLVKVFDFGFADDGSAFVARELCDGESLRARLDREGKLEVDAALHIVRQVCGVLAATHKLGLAHRDLTPANILLVDDGSVPGGKRARLTDYGMAVLREHGASKGEVGLTAAYLAPEQCLAGGQVDARADLYALGCVLYEALCGRPPFSGADREVRAAHLRSVAEPPASLTPGISPALGALIARLLQKSPGARFDDAMAALQAMNGIAAGQPSAAAAAPLPRPPGLPALPRPGAPVRSAQPPLAPPPAAPAAPRAPSAPPLPYVPPSAAPIAFPPPGPPSSSPRPPVPARPARPSVPPPRPAPPSAAPPSLAPPRPGAPSVPPPAAAPPAAAPFPPSPHRASPSAPPPPVVADPGAPLGGEGGVVSARAIAEAAPQGRGLGGPLVLVAALAVAGAAAYYIATRDDIEPGARDLQRVAATSPAPDAAPVARASTDTPVADAPEDAPDPSAASDAGGAEPAADPELAATTDGEATADTAPAQSADAGAPLRENGEVDRPTELVSLEIESDPAGATVIRASDGVRLGTTPYDYEIEPSPGAVRFRLELAGHRSTTVTLPTDRDGVRQVLLLPTGG